MQIGQSEQVDEKKTASDSAHRHLILEAPSAGLNNAMSPMPLEVGTGCSSRASQTQPRDILFDASQWQGAGLTRGRLAEGAENAGELRLAHSVWAWTRLGKFDMTGVLVLYSQQMLFTLSC